MPLLIANIQSSLAKLMDKDNVAFVGYPTNSAQVANNWADAVNQYASLVIPISTTSVGAKNAMIAAMLPGLSAPGGFFAAFISGFTAYALTLGGGMAGAGFVAVPPPVPINFGPLLALPLDGPLSTKISTMASIIDTWFRTGTATPSAGGSPIIWS